MLGDKNVKKRLLISVSLVVFIGIAFNIFIYLKNTINSEIVANLEGQIYYTKRVDGINTIFKSDANLKNEKLIYSHKGKGKDNYGSNNDNIMDYYYDIKSKTISFIAMNNGDWSLFSIKEGEDTATLINKADFMTNTNYINNQTENITAAQKKGSIYITQNGEEKCINKFYGLYDNKFTGYRPLGLSPDGKFLIYHSAEHLTPYGVMMEGLLNGSFGHNYIMDLSTGKSTRFIDASNIQWIMNVK